MVREAIAYVKLETVSTAPDPVVSLLSLVTVSVGIEAYTPSPVVVTAEIGEPSVIVNVAAVTPAPPSSLIVRVGEAPTVYPEPGSAIATAVITPAATVTAPVVAVKPLMICISCPLVALRTIGVPPEVAAS